MTDGSPRQCDRGAGGFPSRDAAHPEGPAACRRRSGVRRAGRQRVPAPSGSCCPSCPRRGSSSSAAAAFARRSARARLARASPLVRAFHRRVGAAPRHSAPCETAGLRGDGRLSRPLARAVGAARRRRRAGDLPRPRCRLNRHAPGRAGIVSMDGGAATPPRTDRTRALIQRPRAAGLEIRRRRLTICGVKGRQRCSSPTSRAGSIRTA